MITHVNLINTRKWFTQNSTTGELTSEEISDTGAKTVSHLCYILEPPDFGLDSDNMTLPAILLKKEDIFNKLKKYVAISPGVYPLILAEAPHLITRFPELEKAGVKEFPELLNIKGSQGVFIHPGNFPKDTEECQLPGITRGIDEVGSSTQAWQLIMQKYSDLINKSLVTYIVQRDGGAYNAFQKPVV